MISKMVYMTIVVMSAEIFNTEILQDIIKPIYPPILSCPTSLFPHQGTLWFGTEFLRGDDDHDPSIGADAGCHIFRLNHRELQERPAVGHQDRTGRSERVVLHCCGYVNSVMEDLISDVGIDAKHSFEDAIEPVTSFKAWYGDRIGVVGGIDMDVLARSSPEAVAEYTRKVLEECAPSGGYALGTGNSVANYIPMENFFAMLKEGWKFRCWKQ